MINLTKQELEFLMDDLEVDFGTIESPEVKATVRSILHKLGLELESQRFLMNDQRSTTDQLNDLVRLANKSGSYDAADWIKHKL